jgi:TATA-binding protein-associated factor
LDRLLVLLDTGSSTSIRHTAAKQLAQLAAKTVTGDVTLEEDVKAARHDLPRGDAAAWAELMAVVARVGCGFELHRFHTLKALQILPCLHSKSHETRTAASVALAHICSLVPLWRPVQDVKPDPSLSGPSLACASPEFPQFSVEELLHKGTLLLASSGKEFVKPANLLANPAEVKKARKAAMSRLGLDFLDGVADDDDMDWEKELAADQDMGVDSSLSAVKTEPEAELAVPTPSVPMSSNFRKLAIAPSTSASPAPPPDQSSTEAVDMSGLSAREQNRLKRKRKNGAAAVVATAPPPPSASSSKYSTMPSSTSNSK